MARFVYLTLTSECASLFVVKPDTHRRDNEQMKPLTDQFIAAARSCGLGAHVTDARHADGVDVWLHGDEGEPTDTVWFDAGGRAIWGKNLEHKATGLTPLELTHAVIESHRQPGHTDDPAPV